MNMFKFPVLGDPPFTSLSKDKAVAELHNAGVARERVVISYSEVCKDSEFTPSGCACWKTVYSVKAKVNDWEFYRDWCYWVASAERGGGLTKSQAEGLNKLYRKEIRAYGFAGGTDIGGADHTMVHLYHIDTTRGLKVFVDILQNRKRVRI
ncbi:MAG: hypothetical protein WC444_04495 [Candidatus Paceibacterota bacterium]